MAKMKALISVVFCVAVDPFQRGVRQHQCSIVNECMHYHQIVCFFFLSLKMLLTIG